MNTNSPNFGWYPLVTLGLIFFCCVLLSGCASDIPPMYCADPDLKCYISQAVKGITVIRENIQYWSNIQIIGQAVVVVSGIVATIMIALQGDDNKWWTRPTGLIATELVTGTTSALVAFHVPDSIDKLIDILDRMTVITNEFDAKADQLVAGRSQEEVDKAFKTDPKFREDVANLTNKFASEFNKAKIDVLRTLGTAARLNAPAPAAPAPARPVPPSK
jgi:hypothetical protein